MGLRRRRVVTTCPCLSIDGKAPTRRVYAVPPADTLNDPLYSPHPEATGPRKWPLQHARTAPLAASVTKLLPRFGNSLVLVYGLVIGGLTLAMVTARLLTDTWAEIEMGLTAW